MPTPHKDKTAELIAALRAIADPNKLDVSRSPMPDNLARLALSWLAARPEFENARAVLELYDIADAAARAYDIPRLADEDTARPKARGMNGYMPRVGELFRWSGVTFRRIKGELVERAIRDGERAEVLFPVRYVKAPNNPDLVGGRGLMDIAEAPNFIFEGDDACNDPVGHPLTCDCPFGPVANESSDE